MVDTSFDVLLHMYCADEYLLMLQAHNKMHTGHPCDNMFPNEHFTDGITNGAHWYPLTG